MPDSFAVLIITGPTASGKSSLALALAEAADGVIINADSLQVYEELRIITARPTIEDEARVPHRLYGVLGATDSCSAGRWRDMAVREIHAARKDNRLPIVVGGTGFYLKALTVGLSPIPEIPTDTRRQTESLYHRLGGAAFRRRLAQLDPVLAERLPDGDRQRLTRAYEVAVATGKPLSAWQAIAPVAPLPMARFTTLVLAPPRAILYDRCRTRFDAMLEAGALAEVAGLDGYDPNLPVMKALGVPQLLAVHRGQMAMAEARAEVTRETRRYAKRQLTWIHGQIKPDLIIEDAADRRALSLVRSLE